MHACYYYRLSYIIKPRHITVTLEQKLIIGPREEIITEGNGITYAIWGYSTPPLIGKLEIMII